MHPDDALIGRVLASRYRIDERIGDGAMGIVYHARHIKLERSFAIKVLHPQLLSNDKVRRRFEREAEVAATLRHDNVIGVVDVGETSEGLRYLVMDFAEGETLATLIAQGPMSSPRVLRIAQQLCDGLQHAHDASLIHRDFKPDNVIVQRDRDGAETARIVDFGIALLRDDAPAAERERLTTAGIVLGTPHYMAPEHASGKKVDHRIDLFALGVICFEMLTGRLPFDGDGVEVARSNMMFDMPSMQALAPGVDIDPLLELFTKKLMARSLDDRLSTAKAARELLDLIAKDRDAAMRALGLEPLVVVAPSPRPMLAMPIMSPTRMRAQNTTQPGSSTSTVIVPDTVATIETKPIRRPIKWRTVIAATVAVFLVGIGGLAAWDRIDRPAKRVAAVEPRQTPVSTPAPPPPSPAVLPAPRPVVPEDPIVQKPKPPLKVATRAPTQNPPIANPIPPTKSLPPDTTPSASELAQYYAAVGRKLGYLEKHFGQAVTLELWPRYRNIRIQALLANPEDRRTGRETLERLEKSIDDAIRGAP